MLKRFQMWFAEWGPAVTICLLVVALTWTGISQNNDAQKFRAQAAANTAQAKADAAAIAQTAKEQSCRAIRISDDATISFINKQIRLTFQKNPLASEAFLADLSASYDAAQVHCLTGG